MDKGLIAELMKEGHTSKDIKWVIWEKRLQAKMDVMKENLVDVPIMERF